MDVAEDAASFLNGFVRCGIEQTCYVVNPGKRLRELVLEKDGFDSVKNICYKEVEYKVRKDISWSGSFPLSDNF